jgi:hypothetical protein
MMLTTERSPVPFSRIGTVIHDGFILPDQLKLSPDPVRSDKAPAFPRRSCGSSHERVAFLVHYSGKVTEVTRN